MNDFISDEVSFISWSLLCSKSIHIWFLTILCSALIGVTSMVPLFIISLTNDKFVTNFDTSPKNWLKYVLSFAVGGLLGDVFLHLLPEASQQFLKLGFALNSVQTYLGYWVLFGLFTFAFVEAIFSHINGHNDGSDKSNKKEMNGHTNGHIKQSSKENDNHSKAKSVPLNAISATAYLNLLANGFDNLTHGLAVGASFLVSVKMGILTTLAIIVHEVPHEFGDFAILIKSGFNKWDAVRAQVSIALITILGAVLTLWADSADIVGIKTAWILPFTSGGFLHIALVSLLPDLMRTSNASETLKQSLCIAGGITVMAIVNLVVE